MCTVYRLIAEEVEFAEEKEYWLMPMQPRETTVVLAAELRNQLRRRMMTHKEHPRYGIEVWFTI